MKHNGIYLYLKEMVGGEESVGSEGEDAVGVQVLFFFPSIKKHD